MTEPTIQHYLRDYRTATRTTRQQYTDAEGNVDYASLYGHTSGVLWGVIYMMTVSERVALAERLDKDARKSDKTISDETLAQWREAFQTIDEALRKRQETE